MTTKPQNLAQLKKYLQIGTKLELIEVSYAPEVPERLRGVREVKKVQSNAVAMTAQGTDKLSWLYHEKASKYNFGSGGFSVKNDFNEYLIYKYID